MSWFKVDGTFTRHPKVLSIPPAHRREAVALWVTAGAWCAEQHTGGRIPRHVLADIFPTMPDGLPGSYLADALVTAGLWETQPGGGWAFHDWADYNPTAEFNRPRPRKVAVR